MFHFIYYFLTFDCPRPTFELRSPILHPVQLFSIPFSLMPQCLRCSTFLQCGILIVSDLAFPVQHILNITSLKLQTSFSPMTLHITNCWNIILLRPHVVFRNLKKSTRTTLLMLLVQCPLHNAADTTNKTSTLHCSSSGSRIVP